MDKKRAALVIFGLILLTILLVVKFTAPIITASANSNGTKTFSNGGISFEYPQDWSESSGIMDEILAGDFIGILSGTTLGSLSSSDGSYDLMVQKYSLSDFGANSAQNFLDRNKEDLKDSNATILSENTTNINGLIVNEMLVNFTNPDNTSSETFFAIIIKDQMAYMLQFNPTSVVETDTTAQNGTDLTQNSSVFEDSIPTFQKIISTIKVD
ncbi:hypothetical protein [Methanobacterium paludis]|uniref:PsbP C-terminal domain-containing protein n=1 Tax=Methanobacterium paludis (strain DSM 25820 / JCM 18151 / SWAN1) TaxID=868131 RepID=F6D533_METPW|nr:hypothetical protein [Methanobacterium paludis]AEG17568.1 hypothetical protein MSWAN_0530 [Methanobacterium paludis]